MLAYFLGDEEKKFYNVDHKAATSDDEGSYQALSVVFQDKRKGWKQRKQGINHKTIYY